MLISPNCIFEFCVNNHVRCFLAHHHPTCQLPSQFSTTTFLIYSLCILFSLKSPSTVLKAQVQEAWKKHLSRKAQPKMTQESTEKMLIWAHLSPHSSSSALLLLALLVSHLAVLYVFDNLFTCMCNSLVHELCTVLSSYFILFL